MKDFSSHDLDNRYHTFIIAEAGSNWKASTYEDSLDRAKKLIDVASESGADAVKFQTFTSGKVYVNNAGQCDYLSEAGIKNDINKMIKELSMPYEMLTVLSSHCEKRGIFFASTPFSVQDAKHVDPFSKFHKVASFEINHIKLLEFLASTKKPVIISTGSSSYEEIDFAINFMKKNSSGQVVLLQCTSSYPSSLDSMNISVIPKMKERYSVPIGLSDHSSDPLIAPLLAIGMGATVIEKHFTLDRNLEGPDHSFSLIPDELTMMIKAIRDADKAKGFGKKIIQKEEEELRRFATRSIHAIKNISKGEIIKEGKNIDILRPGKQKRGAEPRFLSSIDGKKAVRDISIGEGVIPEDCIDK